MANEYATVEELKLFMGRGSQIAQANETQLTLALTAASRAVDNWTGWVKHGFWADDTTGSVSTRTFRPCSAGMLDIDVGIMSTSSLVVKIDADWSGSFETTLTVDTDFTLQPDNALDDGWPYTTLAIIGSSGNYWPEPWDGRATVQIAGFFGWPSVPPDVKQATLVQAVSFFKASDAPFGAAALGDSGLAMRVGRGLHPAAETLVAPYRKPAVG